MLYSNQNNILVMHSTSWKSTKITRDDKKIDDVNDETLIIFKPKILNAIDQIKLKEKRPALNTIHEYLSKTEASNSWLKLYLVT